MFELAAAQRERLGIAGVIWYSLNDTPGRSGSGMRAVHIGRVGEAGVGGVHEGGEWKRILTGPRCVPGVRDLVGTVH